MNELKKQLTEKQLQRQKQCINLTIDRKAGKKEKHAIVEQDTKVVAIKAKHALNIRQQSKRKATPSVQNWYKNKCKTMLRRQKTKDCNNWHTKYKTTLANNDKQTISSREYIQTYKQHRKLKIASH